MAKYFIYNSVDSRNRYIKAIRVRGRQFIPQFKNEFVEIPHREQGGIMIHDSSFADYNIEIDCLLNVPADKNVWQIGREIVGLFNRNSWGNLMFDDDPGYVLRAILINSSLNDDTYENPVATLTFRVRGQGETS